MKVGSLIGNLRANRDTFRDAARVGNARVLLSLLGPAWRGFLRQDAKGKASTEDY